MSGARCSLSSVVSKSSSGTLELVPVYAVRNTVDMVSEKLEQGWKVMAADIPDYFSNIDEDDDDITPVKDNNDNLSVSCVSVDDVQSSDQPTLLLLGSEGSGIPSDILNIVQQKIFVPSSPGVHPWVDSLNVSVAAGIIISRLCQHLRNKTKT